MRGDLPNSFPQNRRSRKWRVYRFAKWWKPMKVVGRVRPFNDNPGMMGYPVFSKRAVDALRDFLKPNAEVLPLSSTVGPYYLINVTTIADVLNWRKSKVVWFIGEKPIASSNILDYQFFPKKLEGRSIFRIPESVTRIFVTEEFARRVRDHGLIGFQLVKVWPLPPGTNYMKLHTEQNLHKPQLPGAPAGKTCAGNMVIFHLKLAGTKPRAAEKKLISRLADQLDALLVTDSKEMPLGNLEGWKFERGKCRLILSCPDAGKLEKHLAPLLKKIEWPNEFSVKKVFKPYEELQNWWD
jgi:hypothetical protein